jgi:anti-anti-sigma factor
MEITKHPLGETLELRVKGRLDGYWADHLASGLEEVVREGAHTISLNLAEVTYLSSAGIRIILQFYKQLKGIHGSLAVSCPSEPVKRILELSGLQDLLLSRIEATGPVLPAPSRMRQLDRETATYEVFELTPGASLGCRVVGDPLLLDGCRFREEHCRVIPVPASTFAVGLGAFGNDFEDCRARFGEFLAVAGAAAYLPTDGTNVPDYLVAAGTFVPDLKVLYCLACEGEFARLARFEAKKESGSVKLAELVEACMEMAEGEVAGVAMVAESAGLVGAALRRSPALQETVTAPFGDTQIRDWLSFTAERAYARSLAIAVGVSARAKHEALASQLRPMGSGNGLTGHFHAAPFSYRPLKKSEIDLKTTVSALFESETLRDVLHLIGDDRDISGAGQSEFIRGACWISPVSRIEKA